jgi:hypothetical protein
MATGISGAIVQINRVRKPMSHLGSIMLARLVATLNRALDRLETIALFAILALVAIWLGLDDLVTAMVFVLPGLLALRILLGHKATPVTARRGDAFPRP